MTRLESRYSSQLSAGLGAVPETLELLRLWTPGTPASQLVDTAVESGTFSRATARRTRNLVAEMFAPRYLCDGGTPAERLKFLMGHRLPHEALVQTLLLHTCRAQPMLADFIIEVYWPKYSGGATSLLKADAEGFIRRALDGGKMAAKWSPSTIDRQAGHLVGCCLDFGLVSKGKGSVRTIQRFAIRRETALYLAHDLHFAGASDMALVQHLDWRLFGYEPQEVVRQLRTLGDDGHLIVQSSGELVQISWKYKSMEDCLNALAQR